jgi:hypothetical protein
MMGAFLENAEDFRLGGRKIIDPAVLAPSLL